MNNVIEIFITLEKTKVEIFKKTGSEIGKKAAEKSGGLFSADDWHCSRLEDPPITSHLNPPEPIPFLTQSYAPVIYNVFLNAVVGM